MSAKQITFAQIVCDGCGAAFHAFAGRVAETRRNAADAGWKHREVRYEKSNWPRQVDLCPSCEEPKERAS